MMQYRVIKRFVYAGQTYLPGEVWMPLGAHTDRQIEQGRWVEPLEDATPAPSKQATKQAKATKPTADDTKEPA